MSTPFNLQPRFDEVGACRDASALIRQLNDLNTAPSNKVWNHQRAQRREMWQQLSEIADAQQNTLSEANAPRRRAPRVKPEPQQSEPALTTNVT